MIHFEVVCCVCGRAFGGCCPTSSEPKRKVMAVCQDCLEAPRYVSPPRCESSMTDSLTLYECDLDKGHAGPHQDLRFDIDTEAFVTREWH